MFLLLRLFGVAGATLGLAQRADGCVAVDLLMARQAAFHGRRLLSEMNGKTEINIRYERDPRRKFGNHKNIQKKKKYLNDTLKSDLNVGCIPIDDGACCMRDGFDISLGLLEESPRKLFPTDGGAGGKNP